jgi:urease accessory protein
MQKCMQQEQKERHMVKQISKISFVLVFTSLTASVAEAHTGVGSTFGFAHGFGHPLGGMDHILAMVAVGMFAAHLGGRALWLVPSCFVAMMAVGGSLGISGVELPFVEIGIAMSVIVLGALVALQTSLPTSVAMGIVGFFALFHGHAHGAEMPTDAGGLSYAVGFMLATALLHVTGIALGLGLAKLASGYSKRVIQVGGGAMAAAGVGILTGYL